MDDDIRISLRKDLSQKEYLKLVGFLDSADAKYGNMPLLRIVEVSASGNPPLYRGVVIGLYRDYGPVSVPKTRERSKEVIGNLTKILYELEAF